MAEQSSAAVAVRALVMLGCLIAIPLVAVCGSALPEAIDRALGSWWSPEATMLAEDCEEAPLFGSIGGDSPSSAVGTLSEAPAWPSGKAVEPTGVGSAVCDSEGCRVLPASYEAPLESESVGRAPASVSPLAAHGTSSASTPAAPPVGQSPDSFHSICHRLKELGSTYVLLESWGDGQEQFRFYCKIAIAGNPHYTYRFEATSPDPMAAMANVLRQVESWQAARYGN